MLHELETDEEMARIASRDFCAGQGFASESILEGSSVLPADARHRRIGQGSGGRDQTSAWLEVRGTMFDYPVNLTPDDGTVLVTFPDVPEAITFGMDEDEALLQAVDALETALSFYVKLGSVDDDAVRPAL